MENQKEKTKRAVEWQHSKGIEKGEEETER